MATNYNYIFIISCWLVLFEVYLGTISHASEEVQKLLEKNRLLPKTKGTVKTIECLESGDVIDCVDFWQQPAFNNPITLQHELMNPTRRPKSIFQFYTTTSGTSNESKAYQTWNKYGECPEGTVSIRRTAENNDPTNHHRKYRKGGAPVNKYAAAEHPKGTHHGSQAVLNLSKPYVVSRREMNEFSLGQLWAVSQVGGRENLNSVDAGWMRGNRDRIVNGAEVGYWPANIFTTLADGANKSTWDGEVGYVKRTSEDHTHHTDGKRSFSSRGLQQSRLLSKYKGHIKSSIAWGHM